MMPQPKDPRSYPPEISQILWYVFRTGERVELPCPSRTAAITLRFRFSGYLAALKNQGYKEWEQLGTLIARDNSKAIEKGSVSESEAKVVIEPRSITEAVIPQSLLDKMQAMETEGLTFETQPEPERNKTLGEAPAPDNVDKAIASLFTEEEKE